jgi:hypothetical protein
MVKFWRQSGVSIVLYLDDGIGISSSFESCKTLSAFVKDSLVKAGFLINEEKSIFQPTQKLEWLGLVWNSPDFCLSIPDRRVQDCLDTVSRLFEKLPKITARQLAQCTGKIISMGSVVGNVTRLMTRHCYMLIESRASWDNFLKFDSSHEFVRELVLWLSNLKVLNNRFLKSYSMTHAIVCSGASSVAAGAICSFENEEHYFHSIFSELKSKESSTWRELTAIQEALFSFKKLLNGKCIKILTDCQNCVRIVNSGSTKKAHQDIAFSIFVFCLQKQSMDSKVTE